MSTKQNKTKAGSRGGLQHNKTNSPVNPRAILPPDEQFLASIRLDCGFELRRSNSVPGRLGALSLAL